MINEEQQSKNIAIVGSGITGISIAYHLPAGTKITIFDKSRRPGGRICTRTSRQHPGYSFDHCTPYIEPKDQLLQVLQKLQAVQQVDMKQLDYSCKQNKVIEEKRYVIGNQPIETIPKKIVDEVMNQKKLKLQFMKKINIITQRKVGEQSKFILISQQNKQFGPYDQVFVCIPYPQSKTIVQDYVKFPIDQKPTTYSCTFVVLVAVDKNSPLTQKFNDLDIVRNVDQDIESMINQRLKGNTTEDDLWVATFNDRWSIQKINFKAEQIEQEFKKKIFKVVQQQFEFKFLKAHRFHYSRPTQTPSQPLVAKNIVFGSDWAGKITDVQGCWQLGSRLIDLMKNSSSL